MHARCQGVSWHSMWNVPKRFSSVEFPRKGHRAADTRPYLCGLGYARRVLRVLAGRTEVHHGLLASTRRRLVLERAVVGGLDVFGA
jgi:hypothetical protein